MKPLFLLFFGTMALAASAQSYQANNEVALFIKEKEIYHSFYSKALFVKINLESSDFLFQVDFNTFKAHDTADKVLLLKLFPPQTTPNLCFKGTLSFNSIDKDVSTKQTIPIIGSMLMAGQSYQVTLPVEFEFMDKQLLFDTHFGLDLNKLSVVLPQEYRDKFNTTLLVRIDNGHFLKKE